MVSEDLLKKAVAAFNALSPEQQAEMLEEQRQSWVRGNVGLSRDERGMTSPVMPRPAPADLKARDRKHYKLIRKSLQNKGLLPAATDTGLVTVAENLARTIWGYFKGGPDAIAWFDNNKSLDGPTWLIEQCHSQAGDLLAAERAEVQHWQEQYTEMHSQFIDLAKSAEADNAAKDARIKELEHVVKSSGKIYSAKMRQIEAIEAKLAAAEKALEEADEALQADAIASAHAAIRAVLGGKP